VLRALLLLTVACVLPAASAHASGALAIEEELKESRIYATRAHITVEVQNGGGEFQWHAYYRPSGAGAWIAAASGTQPSDRVIYLGADPSGHVLHHLTPNTAYEARFEVEKGKESSERTYAFATSKVAKPEVAEVFGNNPSPDNTTFVVEATGPRSAVVMAQIESNGAETKYTFEYAPAEAGGQAPEEGSGAWVPFEPGATVTVAQDFLAAEAKSATLTPETKYFARVTATNEKGTTVQRHSVNTDPEASFTTPTASPIVFEPEVRNVTGTSVHLRGDFLPHGLETSWRFQYATAPAGPWSPVAGAEGVLPQAQAEALPEGSSAAVEGSLTGLSPSTLYYVRLFAQSSAGEGHNGYGEPIAGETRGLTAFNTSGPPTAETLPVHGLHGEALRVMGAVNPSSVPTSAEQAITIAGAPTSGTFTLTFKGQTTVPIAFDAPANEGPSSVSEALKAIGEEVSVTGPAGGPYTVYFSGSNGEIAQPALVAAGSGLTVSVSVNEVGGRGYDTHYDFEYVSQKQFEEPGGEGGFAKAASTPPVELGSGSATEYVGADLPGLVAGESYHFRIRATNTSPGNPVVRGEEELLTVPPAPVSASEEAGACPNQALRTGPSANLPDCRAYEQLTPADKEGAQEIYNYGGSAGREGALVGVDGDHLEYGASTVKWGSLPGSGQSPYFFTRGESGWQMIAATVQPQAGVHNYAPQLFAGDLSAFAFESSWETSPANASAQSEFKVGAPGGPYANVASVPTQEAKPGWVAASKDLSTLVLQVADHTLLGHSTGTQEGDDLYEYSKGELRQLNVGGGPPGKTIGSCGAAIAGGVKGAGASSVETSSASPRQVSDDGSRIFFEAVPGKDCSEPTHLYVRENGGGENAQSVDIGAFTFLAADSEGTTALLEKPSGEDPGLYLYKSGSAPQFLASSAVAVGAELTVSEDLSTVYIRAGGGQVTRSLYRYDVADRQVLFITQLVLRGGSFYQATPDGRYLYFIAKTVAGLPAGGQELEQPHAGRQGQTSQVFRYDDRERVVECMSCASSFDPEPRLSALFTEGSGSSVLASDKPIASANGDYVFFDTPAALVSGDVDGEIAPEGVKSIGGEHGSANYSLSSDVYEWRRDGVDGCLARQGCLALITSGGGGFLNILLGSTASGRDVFFATNESLLPTDKDTAADIYDARVGGGFAQPVQVAPCEGDACSTPFAPPSEITPASASFQGAGNQSGPPAKAKAKTKAKAKAKAKPRCKARAKRKCRPKAKGGGRGKAGQRARHATTKGRARR
jgi:hypothetical protein